MTFIWVNKNGTVRKEEIYFNGKLIDTINDNISGSKRKVFTFDGQYELVNYKNDKKQGKFTRYNENDLICGYGYYEEGTIKKQYIYSDFSKKGTYEIKYENGKEIPENNIIARINKILGCKLPRHRPVWAGPHRLVCLEGKGDKPSFRAFGACCTSPALATEPFEKIEEKQNLSVINKCNKK